MFIVEVVVFGEFCIYVVSFYRVEVGAFVVPSGI